MGLQTEGVIFLIIAWFSIFLLLVYCYSKVLSSGRKQKIR